MLLIADTETGKTQILEVFMNLKPVIWANDLSAHVIVDEVAPAIDGHKEYDDNAELNHGGRIEERNVLWNP